ncbi:MAG: chemotaxis response regulator protein-glutamate methylesterase [Pseudomonadota bacterium]
MTQQPQVSDPTTNLPTVLVVDDSRLMRRMIIAGLEAEGTIKVVGEAEDTTQARQMIKALNPDVITLDVEMPGMNGIDFLKKIMELRPMPVIMVSTLTAAGADVSLAALQIGAFDAIQKPAGREDVARFGHALREKVRLARQSRIAPRTMSSTPRRAGQPQPIKRTGPMPNFGGGQVELIAIGASTGGVRAVTQMLEPLPHQTPPIVITQHMPETFTSRFAERLNATLRHNVREATEGEVLAPGSVRIAPGGTHLKVERTNGRLVTTFDQSGPISGHKPSVDVLFNSVSTSAGASAIGVILTGMGRDGAAGLRTMRNAGATTFGQSEDSCVVYGMPKIAFELGAVSEELDLREIPHRICDFLNLGTAIKSA